MLREKSAELSCADARLESVRLFIDSMDVGGNEQDCLQLCNGWSAQGISVELLLVRRTGRFLEALDHRVRIVDGLSERARDSFWKISRILRARPQVPVLVFGFHLATGLLAARWAGLHRAPIIYREGSAPATNISKRKQWAYRWMIGCAEKVIAQNETARNELTDLGVPFDKISVIHNPRPHPTIPTPRPTRVSAKSPLVLGVGRLAPEKGFTRLIRGFRELRARFPDARLVILGEGPERTKLERICDELGLRDCVALPGFVADPGPWYLRASLFALSSHYEGQSNALLEAVLHECPVVCAAGRGGTIELMRAAGLEKCLVPDQEFERRFAEFSEVVLGMDVVERRTARQRLAALTDFPSVLGKYLDVCRAAMSRTPVKLTSTVM